MEIDPAVPQVACFDTAFHRGHARTRTATPYRNPSMKRACDVTASTGFPMNILPSDCVETMPDVARGRVIVAHLGSGASMCALRDGRSVETTMGFTALDGLPMATRPGQMDPGVVLYLIDQKGMTCDEVTDLLYKRSGLKGLSGISGDMRDLLASEDPRAAFAIDHFVHRCALNIGMLAAALGGLDAFVFTAGVGENSAPIRARIAERLGWLDAELEPVANEARAMLISTAESGVALYVLPTDEELMIARHTFALVSAL
jgi:acetate kinase